MSEKTVFISYRRNGFGRYFARSLELALTQRGYDVFLDVDSINSGNWSEQILSQAQKRSHFLLLLTPDALKRCADKDDMVWREFETAMRFDRNIVPIKEESESPEMLEESCPECMQELFQRQITTIHHATFHKDIELLVQRFIPRHKAPSSN